MKRLPLMPYLETLDESAHYAAASQIGRAAIGSDVDFVSPLIGKRSDADYMRETLRDEMLAEVLPTGYAELDDYEKDQSEKIGAYSLVAPYEQRKISVYKYFMQADPDLNPVAWVVAQRAVQRLLPKHLSPMPLSTVQKNMPRGTNLGAPFFKKDNTLIPSVILMASQVIRSNFKSFRDDPAMLFVRGQPRGIGEFPKNRVVWGYPHWITALELMIQEALLPHIRMRPEFAALMNLSLVDRVVTNILEDAKFDVLSVDFSGFDAGVPFVFIHAAFELIAGCFDDPQAKRLVRFIEDRFLHIGLMTPEGILVGRSGGVPSGSGLTNLVDSLVQLLLWFYLAEILKTPIKDITVQGDDGVVSFSAPWDIESVTSAADSLGFVVNADKGGISRKSVKFLQNLHSLDYMPGGIAVHVRPLLRVLNGMMSYERDPSELNGAMVTLRWWQQLETAKWHPKFEVGCRFLFDRDRESGENALVLLKRAGGIEKVERVLRQPSFPYGKESLRGLASFEVVREMARLREERVLSRSSA